MNERIVVRDFGPIRNLDVTFKKTTLFIGDQGTGKSCIAKVFSTFKWLEKTLVQRRYKKDYFEKYNRFKKLLEYHQIDTFLKKNTFIKYQSDVYIFEYKGGAFTIEEVELSSSAICKVMYVPAERSIASIAENKSSLLKQLPPTMATFNDRLTEAKEFFKNGYNLPFGSLKFKYDKLNNVSKIVGNEYEVFLRIASSGVQSSLPLCIVTDYLAKVVREKKTETKFNKEMQQWIDEQVTEILSSDEYSSQVKDGALKNLSRYSYYSSFVNIVEEPELNLFPNSQLEVLKVLTAANASTPDNMLVVTTHSPYTLAIFNLFIMAHISKDEEKLSKEYHINPNGIAAYSLSNDPEEKYWTPILDSTNGMISKNDLDNVSETIMLDFNYLLNKYAQSLRLAKDAE